MKPHTAHILVDTETPLTLFSKLANENEPAFLFESAQWGNENGRYSFIGFGALVTVSLFERGGHGEHGEAVIKKSGKSTTIRFSDPLKILQKILNQYSFPKIKNFPRFQGGLVGYFGYDLVRFFEPVNLPKKKHPLLRDVPEGKFFFPKTLLAFDHLRSTLSLVTFEKDPLFVEKLKEKIRAQVPLSHISISPKDKIVYREGSKFQKKVSRAKEYIAGGECVQIVISERAVLKTQKDDLTLYRGLRATNPSPYMFLLRFAECSIIGSSPETLVRVENDAITVRPIAGTRPRGKNLKEDGQLAKELLSSGKELAEHRMLVDLGRNDVGRVSKPGTVRETKLLAVERYSHVMHIVSEIRGMMDPKKNIFDVFRACFPAGTLTGAPKIRAMEYISELENERRGIYGGAVGYFDISGNMDFAIAIRTIIKKGNEILIQSGAGIVYDSIPEQEHMECIHKARACISIL